MAYRVEQCKNSAGVIYIIPRVIDIVPPYCRCVG